MDPAKGGVEEDRLAVAAVARGDRAAFERVYSRSKDDLLRLLVSLVGDRAASEDLLHDVFVAFARKAKDIRLGGSLRAYLAASCLHRARDVARRERRGAGPAGLDLLESRSSPAPGPSERLAASDEAERLAAALETLSFEQREVVSLHLHGGLTFREIASMLGLSINTAQSRYRYALAALRRLLAPADGRPSPP